jgi:hypothetical protein
MRSPAVTVWKFADERKARHHNHGGYHSGSYGGMNPPRLELVIIVGEHITYAKTLTGKTELLSATV